MESFVSEHKKMVAKANLANSLNDVQQALKLVQEARAQIQRSPNSTAITLARLQNPVKASFEGVKRDLKEVNDAVNKYSKVLDKRFSKPLSNIPYGTLPEQSDLISKAIGMHLLREGNFSAASTLLKEFSHGEGDDHQMTNEDSLQQIHWDGNLDSHRSEELRSRFTQMYAILEEMRAHNLDPATEWARKHRAALELRGSNLEFEIARLNYVWLFGSESNDEQEDDSRTRQINALAYARKAFVEFQGRYLQDVQQLVGAVAFCTNLRDSPYRRFFNNDDAWEELATSFTREFCSLLGLSADSPVYVATTAGTIALPKLLKLHEIMETKHTEWTSVGELPAEIPLPNSFRFHSIFVCPVSKEQTTDENPPMMIPCGHVVAAESLQRITKMNKIKCPYCPSEWPSKDARRIIL